MVLGESKGGCYENSVSYSQNLFSLAVMSMNSSKVFNKVNPPPAPILDKENLNFYFHTTLWLPQKVLWYDIMAQWDKIVSAWQN